MINIRRINDSVTLGTLDIEEFAVSMAGAGKRETERCATELLLKNLYGNNSPALAYTPENKPYFKDNSDHVSISHSHGMLVVLIHKHESCGVDIELIRNKILNIRHKFLDHNELNFAKEDIQVLTLLWAAKEAIYKAYGLKQLDFIANMSVKPFGEHEDEFYGVLQKGDLQRTYRLKKELLGNYALVYTLNEVR